MSRWTKQVPGLYQRVNHETQLQEERQNRALRRKRLAIARKVPGEYRTLTKLNRMHQSIKASRLYETKG